MDYANIALRNASELHCQQLEHDDEQDAFDKLRLEMNQKSVDRVMYLRVTGCLTCWGRPMEPAHA